jgi:thiosulfate dehydrogenase [quinone] large subunit
VSKKRVQPAPSAPAPAADRWLRYATLPLRYFLGATFLYAGLQKIADPGFLQPGSATYIGTQLQAFAAQSPIGFLITVFALPTPQLTGIAVIATELIVGALVIAGIATRWAAVAGAAVNFVFFLTASWNVQPYFLGSDSIYTVAWITLALVGDQGVWTARPLFFGATPAAPRQKRAPVDAGRRRLLIQLGSATVAAVWLLAVIPRSRRTTAQIPNPTPTATPAASPTGASTPTAAATPAGTKVGSAAELKANGFLDFTDPSTGDPAVAVELSGGNVVAFDAVCTHAGCTVQYDSGQKVLACPCHGALFDPAHGAAVLAGPAPTPLPGIKVQVASDGNMYAT